MSEATTSAHLLLCVKTEELMFIEVEMNLYQLPRICRFLS